MHDAPATILKRFKAIEDIHVRRRVLGTTLAAMAPDALGDFVGHLCRLMPDPQHRALWLDVALALVESPAADDARTGAVLARLNRHPHRPVFAFLATPPDVRRAGGGLRETPYDLDDVPLGVRKTRARGRSRDALRVLCEDPEPPVIRILLENPLLVEADVLRIASLRPQTLGTFVEVARSPRFGPRESVLAALVLNPFCPTRLAAALAPMLPRAVLREAAGLAGLDAPVRAAAAALLGD